MISMPVWLFWIDQAALCGLVVVLLAQVLAKRRDARLHRQSPFHASPVGLRGW